MPTFDARQRELRTNLTAIQSRLEGGESTRIAGVLEDYFSARDAALTMMQVLLSEDDAAPLADDYAGRFRDMTRAATDKLDNMLSGLSNPSGAAVLFREMVSFSEFIFWGKLGALGTPKARDSMARDAQKVRDFIAVLDLKWRSLSDEDLRVEEAEQRAAQDLKDMLEQCLATAMPYWLQAAAAAVELRELWKSVFASITEHVKETLVAAGAPRPLVEALLTLASWANNTADIYEIAQKLGMNVDDAMTWLNRIRSMNVGGLVQYRIGTLVDSKTKANASLLDFAMKGIKPAVEDLYQRYMGAFKAQLDNEGVIIVSYGGVRQQVDQFLKDCNLDALRATHAAALTQMDSLDLGTDGQKADWAEVRKAIKDSMDARRQNAENAFNDFYRANDGRFLGGLSTDTERTLLEPDKWKVTTDGLLAVNFDTRLREWRQSVTVIQAGPKDAFDAIQGAFDGLPMELRDTVKSTMNDYLTQQMALLNTEADKAIATLESSVLMVNAKRISDDMDRTRLSQALRATIR